LIIAVDRGAPEASCPVDLVIPDALVSRLGRYKHSARNEPLMDPSCPIGHAPDRFGPRNDRSECDVLAEDREIGEDLRTPGILSDFSPCTQLDSTRRNVRR
jgi:hypothetical protein